MATAMTHMVRRDDDVLTIHVLCQKLHMKGTTVLVTHFGALNKRRYQSSLPPPGGGRGPQVKFNPERPPNNDGCTVPGTVEEGILSLAVGSYRGREIGVGRDFSQLGAAADGIEPKCPGLDTGARQ